MNIDQLITLITGIGTILLTYWYFFGKKELATVTGSEIKILVDAGYSPANIVVKKDTPVILNIFRKDPSDCLDQLIIPEWNIVRTLPLNKEIAVTFTPQETGEFPFHCGMNMFHGKIIVT